jgi:hypothetical protein
VTEPTCLRRLGREQLFCARHHDCPSRSANTLDDTVPDAGCSDQTTKTFSRCRCRNFCQERSASWGVGECPGAGPTSSVRSLGQLPRRLTRTSHSTLKKTAFELFRAAHLVWARAASCGSYDDSCCRAMPGREYFESVHRSHAEALHDDIR